MYELGYDQKMKQTDKYTRYGGVSFSYTDGAAVTEAAMVIIRIRL